jgi:hypothetical protein
MSTALVLVPEDAVQKTDERSPLTIKALRETIFGKYAASPQDDLALPHPQWCRRGLALSKDRRLSQFAVADWLVDGIELNGATAAYDFAEAVFPQYARQTFLSWVTVAKHFKPLFRIESDFLTFGHYQVAQGAERDPWRYDPDSEFQVAKEMVWLRQADERRMSVSALRDAIAHAFNLRQEAFFVDHPDAKPKPVDEPEPAPVKPSQSISAAKEFKTPWLPKQTRWCLDELSRARRMTTEQLLARVVRDFIDAHTDEIGDAKLAAAKRDAEADAAMRAAEAVEAEKRKVAAEFRAKQKAEQNRSIDEGRLALALVEEVQARRQAELDDIVRILEAEEAVTPD